MSKVKKLDKKRNKSIFKKLKENGEFLLLTLPGTLWFLVFAYLPMIGIIIAFKNWRIAVDL